MSAANIPGNGAGEEKRGLNVFSPMDAKSVNVADYEIHEDEVLGQGGMGTVYRGRQISLGRKVAIKIIRSDYTDSPVFVERFRREAELLAQVIDGHVVQVFGAGEWKGRHFYAMEFVEGEDIAGKLQKGYRFSLEEILKIAEGVGKALRAAWKYQIVHRDIKPSNILITPDGTVKVADFGLAKSLRTDQTQSMAIAGTSKYLSPEQGMGDPVDIRSDLYSLGVVLYELSTNKPPFEGNAPTSLIYQHVHVEPTPPRQICPDVPPGLETVILKCMAKKAEERFQNPDEFLRAVRSLAQSRSPGSSLMRPRPALPAAIRRGRRVSTWVGIPVLSLFALFGLYQWVWAGADPVEGADGKMREIQMHLGMGEPLSAMNLAEKHFGTESAIYLECSKRYRDSKMGSLRQKLEADLAARNWAAAADNIALMLVLSDDAGKKELRMAQEFCLDLVRAEKEEGAGRLEASMEILQRLHQGPGNHKLFLKESMDRLKGRIEEVRVARIETARSEGAKVLEAAVELRRNARWADALASARKARDHFRVAGESPAALTDLLKELEMAVAAPAGFVFVPAGPAPMGSDSGDAVERPVHRIQTAAFYIMESEVTRAQYARFLEDPKARSHEVCPSGEPPNKSHVPKGWSPDLPQNEPVGGIDWFDAAAYARWAGLRLPTEAEWEKAASHDAARDLHREYPWGDLYDAEAKDVGFYRCRGMGSGLLEWTQSLFQAYPGGQGHAEAGKGFIVLRGGVLLPEKAAEQARTGFRFWQRPDQRDPRFGLRCVKDIP